MAVVATAAADRRPLRTSDHLRLLVAARWQSYRNLLRKSSVQRAKFLAAVLTWLLAGFSGVGSALAFAALGYGGGTNGKFGVLGIGLFIIFTLWQFAPIFFEVTAPTVSFRDIARYPINLHTYYLLNLAFGLLDPAVLLSLLWLVSLWLGLLIGRPAWAARAILPFLLFAAFNLISNRTLLSLIERVLATRRGRERTLGAIMLLALGAQVFIYGFMPRTGVGGFKKVLLSLKTFWIWTPPGIAATSVASSLKAFVTANAALIGYAVVAAWILRGRLRANFNGECYSESSRRSGAVQVRPGWSLPVLGEKLSTIVEKEVRYALRDSRTLMNLASPTIFALLIVLSRGMFAQVLKQGLHTDVSNWQVHPSVAAILFLSYLAHNSFGTDGSGFARWVLSPATSVDVFIGKNLAVCLLWLVSLLGVNLVLIAGSHVSWRLLMLTLLGVIYGGLAILAAGNQASVRLPTRFEVGTMTKGLSEGVALGSMLLCAVIGGSIWLLYRAAHIFDAPWITPAGLVGLIAVTSCLYAVSLRNAARYLDRNAEKIAAELQ